MTDKDKPNNVVSLDALRLQRHRRPIRAYGEVEVSPFTVLPYMGLERMLEQQLTQQDTPPQNRADIIMDPSSTIGISGNLSKVTTDLLAIAKITGVLCDDFAQLSSFVKERNTSLYNRPGANWVEWDHHACRDLDRAQSIARTLEALGTSSGVEFPIPYRKYIQLVNHQRTHRTAHALRVIERMDNPPVKMPCMFGVDWRPEAKKPLNPFGKGSMLLEALTRAFAGIAAGHSPWVDSVGQNREQKRNRVAKAKRAEGYVAKACAGPKKHGDRNATQFVKEVKPHPLLKGLVKKMEQ